MSEDKVKELIDENEEVCESIKNLELIQFRFNDHPRNRIMFFLRTLN